MDNPITIVLAFLIGVIGPGAAIVLLVSLNPEKVQQWGAIAAYAISRLGAGFKSFHKKAVQLDLQGHINDYVKQLARSAPILESEKVKVELVDTNATRESILQDGTVILRLRRDDPQDMNFVHGAYFFVSSSLLFRIKRYISPSQRDALDLYVTTRLIEREKPAVVDHFLNDYLHPGLQDTTSDRAQYYDQLAIIDRGGLFYPVLLEELHALGSKVFGRRQDDQIVKEVRGLMTFLQGVAQRKVGTDIDLNFKKDYCKSAIMIVGKGYKLADPSTYSSYIRDTLQANGIELIYLLGNYTNRNFVDKVCEAVSDVYAVYRTRKCKMTLNFDDGPREVDNYVVVLHRIGASIYQLSTA